MELRQHILLRTPYKGAKPSLDEVNAAVDRLLTRHPEWIEDIVHILGRVGVDYRAGSWTDASPSIAFMAALRAFVVGTYCDDEDGALNAMDGVCKTLLADFKVPMHVEGDARFSSALASGADVALDRFLKTQHDTLQFHEAMNWYGALRLLSSSTAKTCGGDIRFAVDVDAVRDEANRTFSSSRMLPSTDYWSVSNRGLEESERRSEAQYAALVSTHARAFPCAAGDDTADYETASFSSMDWSETPSIDDWELDEYGSDCDGEENVTYWSYVFSKARESEEKRDAAKRVVELMKDASLGDTANEMAETAETAPANAAEEAERALKVSQDRIRLLRLLGASRPDDFKRVRDQDILNDVVTRFRWRDVVSLKSRYGTQWIDVLRFMASG